MDGWIDGIVDGGGKKSKMGLFKSSRGRKTRCCRASLINFLFRVPLVVVRSKGEPVQTIFQKRCVSTYVSFMFK